MAGVLDSVNQRTQMVGHNRLELLLFRLNGRQMYGINVFKVKEVLQCPKLTVLPNSHPVVRGIAHIRTGTIPILDLNLAIGGKVKTNLDKSFIIITEYNMTTQGFVVDCVERIINTNWEDIHRPPQVTGKEHYLTAVTEVEKEIIGIIDVEKILAEVSPRPENVSEGIIKESTKLAAKKMKVLICDDSRVALNQVKRCLEKVGVEAISFTDGKQTLDHLFELIDQGRKPSDEYIMMISDIEMPEMDGYTLTTEVRDDERMSDLHIVLHTSLSGVFNKAMVKKVGANDFLAKFMPDDLATLVASRVAAVTQEQS